MTGTDDDLKCAVGKPEGCVSALTHFCGGSSGQFPFGVSLRSTGWSDVWTSVLCLPRDAPATPCLHMCAGVALPGTLLRYHALVRKIRAYEDTWVMRVLSTLIVACTYVI